MEEDPKKIQKILDELNRDLPKPVWEDAIGYHSLTTITFSNGGINFDLSSGIIVKAFVNNDTGELRTYYYKKVLKN